MNNFGKREEIKSTIFYTCIIIGIILAIFLTLYLYHVSVENLWEKKHFLDEKFNFYNTLLLIIFSLIAFISIYFLIKTKLSSKKIFFIIFEKVKKVDRKKLIFFVIGIFLIAIAVIIWIPFHEASFLGIFAGILGTIGLFLLVLSRSDANIKRTIGILIFLIGALIVISVPIHEAFRVSNVGLWSFWNLLLLLIGIIIATLGIVILEKENYFSKIGYFTFFVFGAFAILLIPFHEAIDLNATKTYGEYDISLAVFASFIMYIGAFLFIIKRWKCMTFLDYVKCGERNYILGKRENGKLAKKYFSKSIICYWLALEIYSDNAKVWNNLGNSLLAINEFEFAKRCYEIAIDLDENYFSPYNGNGIVFLKLKKLKKALIFFDKALEINPNNKEVWNNKGIALYFLKKINEARDCFEKAIEIDTSYVPAIRNRELCIRALKPIKVEIAKEKKPLKVREEKKNWLISVSGISIPKKEGMEREIFKNENFYYEGLAYIEPLNVLDYDGGEILKGLKIFLDTIKISEEGNFEKISVNAIKFFDKNKWYVKAVFLIDKDENLDLVYFKGKAEKFISRGMQARLIEYKRALQEFDNKLSLVIEQNNFYKWKMNWKN